MWSVFLTFCLSDDEGAAVIPDGPIGASRYCETIAPFFCDFYLRCGRMAVDSQEGCLAVFQESCEGRYEPHYVALAEVGALVLSGEGVQACKGHLDTVSCAQQWSDLGGDCGNMWQGQWAAGANCSYSIESFVCDESSTCRQSFSGCGKCVTRTGEGGACPTQGASCAPNAFCGEEGKCVVRKVVGEPCLPKDRCALGTGCVEGLCQGPSFVGLGEACDQINRCPYVSSCDEGVCQTSALLGESCAQRDCETGFCGPEGICLTLLGQGFGCSADNECVSGGCQFGVCASTLKACMTR
jgi:hypothetical protein